MTYKVLNINNGESWTGEAKNANEAYKHIKINSGDTTSVKWGKLSSIKEWRKNNKE